MRRFVSVALIAAACGGTQHPSEPAHVPPAVDAGVEAHELAIDAASVARRESAHAIEDETTWRSLAARPTTSAVARTEVVKFLVDLTDDRRIWFIDTERWEIHYYFARDRLGRAGHPIEDHGAFNTTEYRTDGRRFEMGSVVHYLDADLWTMELVSGDTLSGPRIVTLFRQIASALWIGDRLRFRAISPLHETSIEGFRDQLATVTTDEVFRGIAYEPLTNGTAFGTLRIVHGALDLASVRPDEVLVLERLPDEIPVVAGVVSAELQAPLGHIAVLCATRETPNMALRTALSDPSITALEGQLVALSVAPQEWSIRSASRDEAEAAWASRRPSAPLVPQLDASEAHLRPLRELRLSDANTVGAKAAQLGEAASLEGVSTPGGFAIPFHHYLAHLDRTAITPTIAPMMHAETFRTEGHARDAALADLRSRIEAAAVDPSLIREIARRIQSTARDARWILRSSTNAEDLPGFTGAGLYRSIIVPAHATDDQIATALRQVWSSVWLLGAFEEREWYRVQHDRVAMAVLAEPFVDGAAVNGVAITANPFFEGRPGYFINAQALGGSVTGATGDEVPEQHLIYTYMDTPELELLSRSSRSEGTQLLSELDLLHLDDVLTVLHQHFPARWARGADEASGANACDVEFLVAGAERRIVILQVRPYTVHWGPGQTWD
jgi:hypothetical protein